VTVLHCVGAFFICTQMTTVDQNLADEPDEQKEPLMTLRTYRSGAALRGFPPKWKDDVFMGYVWVAALTYDCTHAAQG
jgi:hypothetical protein